MSFFQTLPFFAPPVSDVGLVQVQVDGGQGQRGATGRRGRQQRGEERVLCAAVLAEPQPGVAGRQQRGRVLVSGALPDAGRRRGRRRREEWGRRRQRGPRGGRRAQHREGGRSRGGGAGQRERGAGAGRGGRGGGAGGGRGRRKAAAKPPLLPLLLGAFG